MTETLLPAIDAAVPTPPHCYLNEGNFQEPRWREVFYGENYARLLAVKDRYDPDRLLYATTAVGQEYHRVGDDHRLCKVLRP